MCMIWVSSGVHTPRMDNAQCTPSCDATTLNAEVHESKFDIIKCTQKTHTNFKNQDNSEHYVHKKTQQNRWISLP